MATRKTAGEGENETTGAAGRSEGGKAAAEKSALRAPAKKAPAKKAPAKKAPAKKSTGGSAGGAAGKAPDLKKDLRDFASGRPQGWSHADWEAFLAHLSSRGHDTSNADAIGLALERERLALALQQVDGLSAQQVKTLANRFTTLWSLRNAEVEDIEAAAKIPRDVAERIKRSVQPH